MEVFCSGRGRKWGDVIQLVCQFIVLHHVHPQRKSCLQRFVRDSKIPFYSNLRG